MRKQWNYIRHNDEVVTHLQEVLKIHPVLCQILAQRGIYNYREAKAFFRPQLYNLHDPYLMKGMDKAVQRLETAIEEEEKILLYGDYDVDGTCSVAMMHTFLKNYHDNLIFYLPSRYKEGYGISTQGIEYAKEQGVQLIIAMDCGVKAIEPVKLANEYKIDCIICDHHEPGEILPDALAVLDPKRVDCPYPYKELTGCGIAFKLAQAYQMCIRPDWKELESLLDILAVSIACDIVPITGENRILAHFGLQLLNTKPNLGLKTLIKLNGQEGALSIRDVVFGLGPKINAAGRVADADVAVHLLLSKKKEEAEKYALVLQERNELRRGYEAETVKEAKEMYVERWEDKESIVLYNQYWNKGVLGIAAARMVDYYYKPSVILAQSNGKAVGSARSVSGFNIYEALTKCKDLLENYGGHEFAGGLTILPENIDEFRTRFENIVQEDMKEPSIPELEVMADIQLKDVNEKFWKILKQFAPFGPGNRNPLFVTKNVQDTGDSKILKEKHLRLVVQQKDSPTMTGIGFGLGHYLDEMLEKDFHICYNIQENHWRGKTNLQLNVKDVKF